MTSPDSQGALPDWSRAWGDALGGVFDAQALEAELSQALDRFAPIQTQGRVTRAVGLLLSASGLQARLGEICELRTPGTPDTLAEVVGFSRSGTLLTPLGETSGLSAATAVIPTGRDHSFPVGPALLGRVLDGFGQPLDRAGPVAAVTRASAYGTPPNPLDRQLVDKPLATGVRAIDALLTVGVGQRVGILAPAGVGKSTLLGMIARGASADVNVVALIGERGREVREFIEHHLPKQARARTVLVVSTSDRPAMERVKSAFVATAIAEYFRDQGQSVLLLMDSLTRFARAQREVGLASGEPPARRSFPPSTFAMLPRLLERAGPGAKGSITAFYTVLVEGEEESDPIAEEVRSIVDGHIVLTRKLATEGQYPPIDLLASISRVMPNVADAGHMETASQLRRWLARYQEIELLLQIGEYKAGSDPDVDRAVAARDALRRFFAQRTDERVNFEDVLAEARQLVERYGHDTGHPAPRA